LKVFNELFEAYQQSLQSQNEINPDDIVNDDMGGRIL